MISILLSTNFILLLAIPAVLESSNTFIFLLLYCGFSARNKLSYLHIFILYDSLDIPPNLFLFYF
nr:MAG TPA_asm: hypothetical protein [Bacteriophage sp.]